MIDWVKHSGEGYTAQLGFDGPRLARLEVTADEGREIIPKMMMDLQLHRWRNTHVYQDAPPVDLDLHAPPGKPYGDDFYQRVADAYHYLCAQGDKRVVVRLAEINDAPPSTAYGWVKEARRRGLIRPGRAGMPG